MANYKFKFLVFQTKPKQMFRSKHIVAQVEVTELNNFQIGAKWAELEKKYPLSLFISCLTSTNTQLREFQDDTKELTETV